MTVAYPSTPASYFHLLRRQAYAAPRRPLIVFTPKSMLRLKAAASSAEDFTTGGFRPVMPDHEGATQAAGDPRAARRRQGRLRPAGRAGQARGHRDGDRAGRAALPAAGKELADALARYPHAEVVVVQDEPPNMGAWPFMALNLPESLAEHDETRPIRVVSRARSASPAAGSTKQHQAEQADLVARAFDR